MFGKINLIISSVQNASQKVNIGKSNLPATMWFQMYQAGVVKINTANAANPMKSNIAPKVVPI